MSAYKIKNVFFSFHMSVTFVTLDANDVEAAAVATQQDDARKRAKAFLKKYFMRGAEWAVWPEIGVKK